jgi:tRNA threonylcarbamoyladenosine biosynthesis protein TsaE
MPIALTTATADDTRAVGAALASILAPGDVLLLTGDLGAGKTTLTQGIAAGLGAAEHVASPTFTLVREYASGRLPVAHVDVYRLRRAQDVLDLALDELEGGHDGVLIVEWGDAVADLLGPERLRIELTAPDPVAERRSIDLEGAGPSWDARHEVLVTATTPWRDA